MTPFSAEAVHLRRNRWLELLAWLPIVVAPFAAFAIFRAASEARAALAALAALQLVLLGVVAHFAVVFLNPRPVRARARVEVDDRGLLLNGALTRRDAIKSGFVTPRDDGAVVRLEQRGAFGGPIEIAVDSVDEGRALLRALGLDATQTRSTFHALSRVFADPTGSVVWILALLVPFLALLVPGADEPPLFAALPLLALLVGMVPTRLEIGVDGVSVAWMGTRRFLPYGDIERVAAYERKAPRSAHGVRFELTGGRIVDVAVGGGGSGRHRVEMLLERVQQAIAVHQQGIALDASALRRGDVELRSWISRLRGIGAGAQASHRAAHVDAERLLRIALDPSADASTRAAAAVALGAADDADARGRLREASATTAGPRLRAAFEAAGDATREAELEALLAELDAQEQKPRRTGRAPRPMPR